VYERLDALDSDTTEARAASILHGLGFDKEMQVGGGNSTAALPGSTAWQLQWQEGRIAFAAAGSRRLGIFGRSCGAGRAPHRPSVC
jgi:hypothetical protein